MNGKDFVAQNVLSGTTENIFKINFYYFWNKFDGDAVELAGVIVAAALITAALIGFGIWMHFRRKKSKSQELNSASGRMNGGPNHHPVAPQVSVISMETDVRPAGEFASPKSSNSSNSSTMLASNLFRSRIIG